ncbi:MAG: hypothetical protein IKW53_04080 [Clostridia bacterium]|nr:hypothetical protein [Clostridia bacterium]
MKKKILALLLALVIGLLALTSCDILWGDVADEGKVTVVVENADGTYEVHDANLSRVENKSEGAKGIIEHLNKNSNLYLEMVDSTYGAYVSAIGSIKESFADNKYVMVYTSVATDSYDGAPTVQYEGVTLYQAGLGLSGMTVDAGTVILFRLEASPY